MSGAEREPARAEELVLATCHEVGNLLAAIRLHAHLLDDEAGPRALAEAVVEIEDLSDRAGSLLALVRPVLRGGFGGRAHASLPSLLAGLSTLAEGWGRGVRVALEAEAALPEVGVEPDSLHDLLAACLSGAVEEARPGGSVRLRAASQGRELCIEIENDGEPAEDPAVWRDATLRGRPLVFALARWLLEAVGGRAEAERSGDPPRTRLRLQLPARGA